MLKISTLSKILLYKKSLRELVKTEKKRVLFMP